MTLPGTESLWDACWPTYTFMAGSAQQIAVSEIKRRRPEWSFTRLLVVSLICGWLWPLALVLAVVFL